MKKLIPVLSVITSIVAPLSAWAACTTPTADAASMFYNTTVNTVQFCDGTDWYNTGLVVPTASGTACTTPSGPEGSIFYNTTQNTAQFCNGDDWVNMGTETFPSASGTACTVPTGPEGSMFYNTTTSTMQFCNGDNWVNATYIAVAAVAVVNGNEVAKITSSDIAAGDKFGESVSISGDYVIVGANDEDDKGTAAGAAYIFKRTGNSWAQEAKLTASDGAANDYFASLVSISGDYAVVGAPYEDEKGTSAGAAYIFKRTGTSWTQEAKLTASDGAANDEFGRFVSINGDYAVVGAPGEDDKGTSAGAAYVFKRTGSSWAQEAKLTASDGAGYDFLGISVSINGDYAVVGAHGEDDKGTSAGAAYVFKRTGSSWAQEAKLTASDGANYDTFGVSVSIDGVYAIAGAQSASENGAGSGAAYIFKRTGSSWAQEAKLTASDGQSSDTFGHTVSISGDYAIAGAFGEDDNGSNAGAAYIFKRTGTSWAEEHKIMSSDGAVNDQFGWSVAIDNEDIVIGARSKNSNTGAAYIFD